LAADLITVEGLNGGYGNKRVVFDAAVHASPGEVVAVVGHNGAGKTTLLKTIFGMLPAQGGRVIYDGVDISGESCRRNVRRGMALIPAERHVFETLSVLDNLRLGAPASLAREEWHTRLARVYEIFPVLAERGAALAGTLSGGQRRMLSLGMAMMRLPRLLLLDEPSLGLAPALVTRLFETVRSLATELGQAILLVEQNLPQAFAISDRVYVMRGGRVVLDVPAAELRDRHHYWDLF
jgi:branched-chain amino acid transport system ATP-binding protein